MKRLCIMTFILINTFIFANDGDYKIGKSGALMPIINNEISMDSEKIEIEVIKLDKYSYDIIYNCKFLFKNNSNKEHNILMGFPINYGVIYNQKAPYKHKGKNDINNFKVLINNKEINYKLYKHDTNPELKDIPEYDEVYGFNVHFDKNEQIEIINIYKTKIGHAARLLPLTIEYILMSGLTWEKPIKKAEIYVRFNFPVYTNTVLDYYRIKIQPNNYMINAMTSWTKLCATTSWTMLFDINSI